MTRREMMWGGLALASSAKFATAAGSMNLALRSRTEVFRGSDEWEPVTVQRTLEPRQCALVLCDMWDKHWCTGATTRVNALAKKIAPVLKIARSAGIQIIHAPSDTMTFYRDAPERLAIMKLEKQTPPAAKALTDPPLPIDDSDGGCDTGEKMYKAWSRQHAEIPVMPNDFISDKGDEIYSALKLRGITTLFMAGVHTNMCVLNRSFAIRQMTRWGVRCILIRDLTDAMYDPQDKPFVSHQRGTDLVIEHIEKYWAPSVTSDQLVRALRG